MNICKCILTIGSVAFFILLSSDGSLARPVDNKAERHVYQLEAVDQGGVSEVILELLQQLASQALTQSEGETEVPINKLKESNGEEIEDGNDSKSVENSMVFEGDIVTNTDEIAESYGPGMFDDDNIGVEIQKTSTMHDKWPDGIVYYQIDPMYNEREQRIILGAMQEYERRTCLRFKEASWPKRRLYILDNNRGFSSFVGKQKPLFSTKQEFSLERTAGLIHSTVLHELGHAIGLWHEQSRPDRDHYIDLHKENIARDALGNFSKRFYSDYHGEPYDYASIMHYESTAFSINRLETITVSNEELFQLQGRPWLGFARNLSAIDVRQVNKFYGCYVPKSGDGDLSVKVLQAGSFRTPGHYYVCVSAIDSDKNKKKKCTDKDRVSTTKPNWDEELLFKQKKDRKFYSFEIEVLWSKGYFKFNDYPVVAKQTIWVESAEHHDHFDIGGVRVTYQYKLVNN